jgi:polyhydroxyalkanoate synthase
MLDAVGLGPVLTPSRVVGEMQGARLRAYQRLEPASRGPVLLIVPAPIKRAYVWDLLPEVSVVRQALRGGVRVYLLEWLDPGASEDGFGLSEYAERLPLAALDAIATETGETACVLAGHSLGGTCAVILASLHPDRVRGVVLVDAPLAFGRGRGGPIANAVAAAPHARVLRQLAGGSPVPGFFLGLLGTAAVPDAFVLQRWIDLGPSAADPLLAAIHMGVDRWMLDELAMPGRLFEEAIEWLYREDQLLAGTLPVGHSQASLSRLRSPVLAVINPLGRVVPPASILARLAAIPDEVPRRVLRYDGEQGAAVHHLGPLVGPGAHLHLWPHILDWISKL